MPNGLGFIRQGDLINETSDVIVNPANTELRHEGCAAKAIATAAGMCLQDKCRHYVKRYGGLRIGKVVHTTTGKLRRRIKYVLHAAGPDARENKDIQKCAELV